MPRIKLIKKRKKYYNANCHLISSLKRLNSNNTPIALLRSKSVGIQQIITVSSNCILYRTTVYFFNMSHQLLSLPILSIVAKKQYKSSIILLLRNLLPKIYPIQSVICEGTTLLQIDKHWPKIFRCGQQIQFLTIRSLVSKCRSIIWVA